MRVYDGTIVHSIVGLEGGADVGEPGGGGGGRVPDRRAGDRVAGVGYATDGGVREIRPGRRVLPTGRPDWDDRHMTSILEPPGHVFVIKGDTRHFACDAYMWASDRALRPDGGWMNAGPDVEARLEASVRADYQAERRFTLPVELRDPASSEPRLILTAVPFTGVRDPDDIVPRVREFFEIASVDAKRRRSMGSGSAGVPLLAVPLFGVGGGGGAPVRGEIFKALYAESILAAARYGVDVAIVLRDPRDYDLAQSIRRAHHDPWPALDAAQVKAAQRLGAEALAQRIVPFMGSGISVSAGAPTWRALIEELAQRAGLDVSTAADLAKNHDLLDQALYLRRTFDQKFPSDPDAFTRSVISAVDVPRYGLAPALLAALDSEQAVTLNYDRLFEMAAMDARTPRRVIPGKEMEPERWLLKLHGTVTDPGSIVLTRDDYLSFTSDRTALSSLVKATLMTRRLLFVGFGVNDPHFHEIVHDVRRSLPDRSEPFGTVLTLTDSPTTRRLWEGELDFIVLASPRTHDIFLDALLAHSASTHSYLMASGYAAALPPADQALREALLRLLSSLPELATRSSAWPQIEQQLTGLGAPSVASSASTSVALDARLPAAELQWHTVPESPGIIMWFRDDECVYVGVSGNLRERISTHLSRSRDLSRSTLRSWVAVHTLGLDRAVTRRRPSVLTQEQADTVTDWLTDCEVAWKVTDRRQDATRLKAKMLTETRPLFNRD